MRCWQTPRPKVGRRLTDVGVLVTARQTGTPIKLLPSANQLERYRTRPHVPQWSCLGRDAA